MHEWQLRDLRWKIYWAWITELICDLRDGKVSAWAPGQPMDDSKVIMAVKGRRGVIWHRGMYAVWQPGARQFTVRCFREGVSPIEMQTWSIKLVGRNFEPLNQLADLLKTSSLQLELKPDDIDGLAHALEQGLTLEQFQALPQKERIAFHWTVSKTPAKATKAPVAPPVPEQHDLPPNVIEMVTFYRTA